MLERHGNVEVTGSSPVLLTKLMGGRLLDSVLGNLFNKGEIMEQVWKCDFCIRSNKEKSVTRIHEEGCSFNPKNKGCHTCNNCVTTYWGGVGEDDCIKGNSIYSTEDGECDQWEIQMVGEH